MRRLFTRRLLIPLIVVGLLATFATVGWLSAPPDLVTPATVGEQGRESAAVGPRDEEALAAGEADKGGTAATEDLAAAVPPAALTADRYLLRNGNLSLQIERDTLLATVQRITAMVADMDGYVLSSSLNSQGADTPVLRREPTGAIEPEPADGSVDFSPRMSTPANATDPTQAWLTLRVPEARFDTAMKRFSSLGDVQSVSTSSEDVTAQFVDLNARLRHHRAVEQRLLRFLEASSTIREMLVVQDRLDAVQLTIEQLEAQLKSLREVTAYSTVTISLAEKGTPQAGAIDPSDTFAGVLMNSLEVLARGARVVALAITAALPFVVVLGGPSVATWYLVRRLRRRHAQQSSLPT